MEKSTRLMIQTHLMPCIFIYKKLHFKNVYNAYKFVVFIHCRSKGWCQ